MWETFFCCLTLFIRKQNLEHCYVSRLPPCPPWLELTLILLMFKSLWLELSDLHDKLFLWTTKTDLHLQDQTMHETQGLCHNTCFYTVCVFSPLAVFQFWSFLHFDPSAFSSAPFHPGIQTRRNPMDQPWLEKNGFHKCIFAQNCGRLHSFTTQKDSLTHQIRGPIFNLYLHWLSWLVESPVHGIHKNTTV